MGTKVKGLLKGFCQLSNIFDAKDQEMHIGFPTDVKHVAHIGWDGPPVNSSGLMNETRSTDPANKGGANKESPAAKPSKRTTTSDVPNADAETAAVPKHSRRRQLRSDCPSQESAECSRRGRREQKSGGSGSSDSSTVEGDVVPKQPRRKKVAKGSTGGSVRSSRSKDVAASSEQLPGPPLGQ